MDKDLKEAWKVLFNFGKPIETIEKEELIELVKEAESLLEKAFHLINDQDELIKSQQTFNNSQNKYLMNLQRFTIYGSGGKSSATYSEKDNTGEWVKYLDLPIILESDKEDKTK